MYSNIHRLYICICTHAHTHTHIYKLATPKCTSSAQTVSVNKHLNQAQGSRRDKQL